MLRMNRGLFLNVVDARFYGKGFSTGLLKVFVCYKEKDPGLLLTELGLPYLKILAFICIVVFAFLLYALIRAMR